MHEEEYKFAKHTLIGKRFEDRITITRSNHIGFPTQFWKDNNVDDYKYVVLFYDKNKNAVGIKLSKEQEAGAIAISRNNNDYGGYISATSFFRANRINTKKYSGRYDHKTVNLSDTGSDESGVIFVIELRENVEKEVKDEA